MSRDRMLGPTGKLYVVMVMHWNERRWRIYSSHTSRSAAKVYFKQAEDSPHTRRIELRTYRRVA